MKVIVVAAPRLGGGAARATERLIDAISLAANESGEAISFEWMPAGITPPSSSASDIAAPPEPRSLFKNSLHRIPQAAFAFFKKLLPHHPYSRGTLDTGSFPIRRTGLAQAINESDADLVHINWIGSKTISIREISQIRKPIVWTMHDMWTLCGAEHVCYDNSFLDGYKSSLRRKPSLHLVLNRLLWLHKKRSWRRPLQLVAPTTWLEESARNSALTKGWPVVRIPLPIDTDFWSPGSQTEARARIGLAADAKIVMYGAMDGLESYNKGGLELLDALGSLSQNSTLRNEELILLTCGQPAEIQAHRAVRLIQLGTVDSNTIRDAYRAADVVVNASLVENFGQVAAEAQACGTPVIGLWDTGLSDIIADEVTGSLIRARTGNSLTRATEKYLTCGHKERNLLARRSAKRAMSLWGPLIVGRDYLRLYTDVTSGSGSIFDPNQ